MKKIVILLITLLMIISTFACTIDKTKNISKDKLNVDEIESIGLYSLDGELLLEIKTEQYQEIANSFNNAKVDNSSYIEMIIEPTILIKLNDGKHIFIHSYGSETNIVATIKDENDQVLSSEHLITPEIAKIIIDFNN